MSAPLSPIPDQAPVVEPQTWTISGSWYRWLFELWLRVKSAAQTVSGVSLTLQQASIATTTIWAVVQSGTYRVGVYLRITTAATVSSSATVTITWKEGGVTQTLALAAVTGNTTTTYQQTSVPVHADSGTLITYAVAYASVGATPMQFRIDVTTELVN